MEIQTEGQGDGIELHCYQSHTARNTGATESQEIGKEQVFLHSQPSSSRAPKSGLQSCESGLILSTCYRCSGEIVMGPCVCKNREEESPPQSWMCEDSQNHCWLKARREEPRGTHVSSFQSWGTAESREAGSPWNPLERMQHPGTQILA